MRPVNASMGMMLETVSHRLLAPGEAHHRCPDKVPKVRIAALKTAGELRIRHYGHSARHRRNSRRTRGRSICDS